MDATDLVYFIKKDDAWRERWRGEEERGNEVGREKVNEGRERLEDGGGRGGGGWGKIEGS